MGRVFPVKWEGILLKYMIKFEYIEDLALDFLIFPPQLVKVSEFFFIKV